jgi:ribosomal protein S12 methylthiotransferase accessory factor
MAGETQIVVTFPGRKRVDAQVGAHVVRTDQPLAGGGEDSAPTPFALFAASLATCAGIFVVGFCQKRGLPTEGIRVLERLHHGVDGVLAGVDIDIEVPASFPEKYRDALVRVADQCSVKRAIQAQPRFQVRTVVTG